jgi:hypothetical protein
VRNEYRIRGTHTGLWWEPILYEDAITESQAIDVFAKYGNPGQQLLRRIATTDCWRVVCEKL